MRGSVVLLRGRNIERRPYVCLIGGIPTSPDKPGEFRDAITGESLNPVVGNAVCGSVGLEARTPASLEARTRSVIASCEPSHAAPSAEETLDEASIRNRECLGQRAGDFVRFLVAPSGNVEIITDDPRLVDFAGEGFSRRALDSWAQLIRENPAGFGLGEPKSLSIVGLEDIGRSDLCNYFHVVTDTMDMIVRLDRRSNFAEEHPEVPWYVLPSVWVSMYTERAARPRTGDTCSFCGRCP